MNLQSHESSIPLASRMVSEIAAAAPRVADDDGIVKPPPANPKMPPPPPNNSPLIKAKTPAAAVSADHIVQCPPTPLEARISSSTHSFFFCLAPVRHESVSILKKLFSHAQFPLLGIFCWKEVTYAP